MPSPLLAVVLIPPFASADSFSSAHLLLFQVLGDELFR